MALRLYRLLLRLLPAEFRREAGDDLIQLFADHRREAAGHPVRLARVWLAACLDLVTQGASMRWAARPRPGNERRDMYATWNDLRHGIRLIRRHPLTSILAVATLALGIGANTAIFSLVDPVLIQALPYPQPDRLVMLWEKRAREGVLTNPVSSADYLDWRRLNTVFEHVAGLSTTSATLTGDGEPARASTAMVGWNLFELLRVAPANGRSFRPEDEVAGRHRVIILSHRFWRQRYGGDPHVVGRKVTVNSGPTPWEIIGVLPGDFAFINDYDIYVPLLLEIPGQAPSRVSHDLDVYARLKPDILLAQATDEMDRIGRELEQQYPNESSGHGSHVTPMRDRYVGDIRDSLVAVAAAVGLVLLIACVNVASLLLARAATRQREMAVRSALGANRSRLITQSLAESLGLSLLGGAAGIGLGMLLIRALPLVMPERLSVVGVEDLTLDWRALGFAAGLSLLTGLAFGLLPALQASRPAAADMLAAAGRGPSAIRRRARVALVIGEMALASLALVGAGLVVRSYTATLAQSLGFESAARLAVTVALPAARYASPESRRLALEDLERRFAAIPGVAAVGAIDFLPLGGGDARMGIGIDGREPRVDEPPVRAHPRTVTLSFFEAMHIPVLRGRPFNAADSFGGEAVVIINDAARRRYWGDSDPIGQVVRFGRDRSIDHRIVGVVGDVRHWGPRMDVNPTLYRPQAQAVSSSLTFVLRASSSADELRSPVRDVVKAFDTNLPIAAMRTMDDVVSRSVATERAQTTLMGAFAALALLLAIVGVYGVTTHVVAARSSEIGLRMTLGARPVDVLRELLSESLRHAAAGLVIGLAAGVLLMKLGAAVLFGVAPWDPVTLAAVACVVFAAAAVACLIPAARAMRVDPVIALRQD